MKKLHLIFNYSEIKARIEIDKDQYKVGEWAKNVGMSVPSISNIHGKSSRINPSLEYVIAVARFTGKPVEWYLYGDAKPEVHLVKEPSAPYDCGEHWSDEDIHRCKQLKKILDSNHPIIKPAIISNLDAFEHGIDQANNIDILTKRVNHLEDLIKPGIDTDAGKVAGIGSKKKAT